MINFPSTCYTLNVSQTSYLIMNPRNFNYLFLNLPISSSRLEPSSLKHPSWTHSRPMYFQHSSVESHKRSLKFPLHQRGSCPISNFLQLIINPSYSLYLLNYSWLSEFSVRACHQRTAIYASYTIEIVLENNKFYYDY